MMAESDAPIIRVRNLSAGYGETVLLERLDFDVHRGEVFVILGGSGSGKSTLLKHMIGLLEPQNGSVIIDGDDIISATGDARRAILRKIGVMYQSGALFGSMTLYDNVANPKVIPKAFLALAENGRHVTAGAHGGPLVSP